VRLSLIANSCAHDTWNPTRPSIGFYVASAPTLKTVNRVREVGTNGIITTIAGGIVDPYGGFAGDGGAATNAGLFHPDAVALHFFGNLLIADANNNRIRQVIPRRIIFHAAPICIPAVIVVLILDPSGARSDENSHRNRHCLFGDQIIHHHGKPQDAIGV